jgi:predicted transcriptional regulator
VLTALWRRQEATARELYEELGRARGIVYTTIAKVLDRLVEKGIARRKRKGTAFVYRAVAKREETHRAMAREFIDQISGGPRPAIAALLGALDEVSPDLLDELEAEIKAWRRRDES